MSRPLQAKLLRFLEDGTFTRVGGTQELRVNVRLIAATNRDIVKAIAEDHFREDLFHRLNVVQMRLPPLREREEDVLLLADHFLKTFSFSLNKANHTLSRAAGQKLLSHRWPGNVRELRNVIERALILEPGPEILPSSLPDFQLETRLFKDAAPKPPSVGSLDEMMAQYEKDLIGGLLEQNHFNLAKTAERLKISRHALRYRMQRLNLAVGSEDEEESAGSVGKNQSLISMRPFFAQQPIPVDIVPTQWQKMDAATRDILMILGAVAVVTLLVLMWAVVFRKRRRGHSRHHSHQSSHSRSHSHETASEVETEDGEESPPESGTERKKRRHRRRREHRPRNPTLAETGGLPPVRTGRPPDPYP